MFVLCLLKWFDQWFSDHYQMVIVERSYTYRWTELRILCKYFSNTTLHVIIWLQILIKNIMYILGLQILAKNIFFNILLWVNLNEDNGQWTEVFQLSGSFQFWGVLGAWCCISCSQQSQYPFKFDCMHQVGYRFYREREWN